MVGVRERPPAADGDEAGVAVFGEDHGYNLFRSLPNPSCSAGTAESRPSITLPEMLTSRMSGKAFNWLPSSALSNEADPASRSRNERHIVSFDNLMGHQ